MQSSRPIRGLRYLGLVVLAVLGAVARPAAAATVLNLGDTVTATGSGTGQTLTVTPSGQPANPLISPTIAYGFSGAFNGTGQLATGSDFNLSAGPWNFQDDFYFTTTGSTVTGAAISIPNAPGASLTDLQARIIMVGGNPTPTIGAPAGGTVVDSWVTLTVGNAAFFLLGAGTLTPGVQYELQVRGESAGPSSYGGAIEFLPMPLPAALPLLLAGLGCLSSLALGIRRG